MAKPYPPDLPAKCGVKGCILTWLKAVLCMLVVHGVSPQEHGVKLNIAGMGSC